MQSVVVAEKDYSPGLTRNERMQVKVKFIGRYIDLTGIQEFNLNVSGGDSIWHVVDLVVKQYPQLEKDKKFIMISKNNIFTNREAKIKEDDEITLSPPVVSGG
jgi:molybdopterin converting factor small subunit